MLTELTVSGAATTHSMTSTIIPALSAIEQYSLVSNITILQELTD